MTEKKTKPGVILYFDSVRPAMKRLNDAQLGELFRAVIDYAEFGELTELDDMTGVIFDMLVPKLDRDAEKYEEGREQRRYAVYVREAKKAGCDFLNFDEWQQKKIEPIPSDTARYCSIPSDTTRNGPYQSKTKAKAQTQTQAQTQAITQTQPESTSEALARSQAGTGEECKGEAAQLYTEWAAAMDAGRLSDAGTISNQLYRLGFDVDRATRELRRRQ